MSMTKRSRNRGIPATLAKSRSVLKACGRGGGTGATRASAHNPPTRGRGGSPRSTASSGAVDQSGSARRRFDSQRPAPPPRKAARRPHRDHEVGHAVDALAAIVKASLPGCDSISDPLGTRLTKSSSVLTIIGLSVPHVARPVLLAAHQPLHPLRGGF